MSADAWTIAVVVAMGLATYLTRAAGLALADRLPRSGPVRVALDALPPAVLTAVVAPAVVAGPAELVAGAVTAIAAFRLPLIAVVVVGVATAAAMRHLLG